MRCAPVKKSSSKPRRVRGTVSPAEYLQLSGTRDDFVKDLKTVSDEPMGDSSFTFTGRCDTTICNTVNRQSDCAAWPTGQSERLGRIRCDTQLIARFKFFELSAGSCERGERLPPDGNEARAWRSGVVLRAAYLAFRDIMRVAVVHVNGL